MNDRDLAELGVLVARSVELRGGVEAAGVIRQMARRILELSDPRADDGCERCGSPIEQKATGRPRRFCSERCRKGAGKSKVLA